MNPTAPAQNSNGWGRNDDNNSILKISTSHAFNIILREHCGLPSGQISLLQAREKVY